MRIHHFLFFLTGCTALATPAPGQHLTVVIKNIRNDKGKVGAALYNSEKAFLKTEFETRSVKASPGEVTLVFDKVPKGNYAISILHDFNDNGKMDTNAVGIPKEGYGFSNNVMGTFGPPKFSKAKIEYLGTDLRIEITMKYF